MQSELIGRNRFSMRLLGWVVIASAAAALSGTLKKDILKKLYFDVEQNAKGVKDLFYIALMNRKSELKSILSSKTGSWTGFSVLGAKSGQVSLDRSFSGPFFRQDGITGLKDRFSRRTGTRYGVLSCRGPVFWPCFTVMP